MLGLISRRQVLLLSVLLFLCLVAYFGPSGKNKDYAKEIELEDKHRMLHIKLLKERIATLPAKHHMPRVLIVGVEACGSKFLEHAFRQHPSLVVPDVATVHHFDNPRRADVSEYLAKFPQTTTLQKNVDITLGYFNYNRHMLFEIQAIMEDAKVVLLLCDPVKRAVDHYSWQQYMSNIQGKTFEDLAEEFLKKFPTYKDWEEHAKNNEKEMLKDNLAMRIFLDSIYLYKFQVWKEVFYRKENLFILNGDDLFEDPGAVIEDLQTKLEISKVILKRDFKKEEDGTITMKAPWLDTELDMYYSRRSDDRNKRKLMSNPKLLDKLKQFYGPLNQKFFELSGQSFNWI